MGIWNNIEPNMGYCMPNASIAPEWPRDDAADEALLLSADGAAEAAERRTGLDSELTIQARDRILELYDEFRPKLFRYLRSFRLGRDQVDEVIQETFMRLHNQEQENIEGHLSQWLFTVCRNCALKSLKKEDRYIYVEAQEFEQKRCEGLTPLMELERKERVERLMELVKELPKNQYEVVRLRFHHHHSYQEISEITGLSVGNVGFLLNAAMRNLRGKMDRDEKDEKIIYLKKGVA